LIGTIFASAPKRNSGISKHSNQDEKADLDQESDRHDGDCEKHVAGGRGVIACLAPCEAAPENPLGLRRFRFQREMLAATGLTVCSVVLSRD
jgi:hypothetical protein